LSQQWKIWLVHLLFKKIIIADIWQYSWFMFSSLARNNLIDLISFLVNLLESSWFIIMSTNNMTHLISWNHSTSWSRLLLCQQEQQNACSLTLVEWASFYFMFTCWDCVLLCYQSSFELWAQVILLPQPPEIWDFGYVPPCQVWPSFYVSFQR
jgi:hypothetical protein